MHPCTRMSARSLARILGIVAGTVLGLILFAASAFADGSTQGQSITVSAPTSASVGTAPSLTTQAPGCGCATGSSATVAAPTAANLATAPSVSAQSSSPVTASAPTQATVQTAPVAAIQPSSPGGAQTGSAVTATAPTQAAVQTAPAVGIGNGSGGTAVGQGPAATAAAPIAANAQTSPSAQLGSPPNGNAGASVSAPTAINVGIAPAVSAGGNRDSSQASAQAAAPAQVNVQTQPALSVGRSKNCGQGADGSQTSAQVAAPIQINAAAQPVVSVKGDGSNGQSTEHASLPVNVAVSASPAAGSAPGGDSNATTAAAVNASVQGAAGVGTTHDEGGSSTAVSVEAPVKAGVQVAPALGAGAQGAGEADAAGSASSAVSIDLSGAGIVSAPAGGCDCGGQQGLATAVTAPIQVGLTANPVLAAGPSDSSVPAQIAAPVDLTVSSTPAVTIGVPQAQGNDGLLQVAAPVNAALQGNPGLTTDASLLPLNSILPFGLNHDGTGGIGLGVVGTEADGTANIDGAPGLCPALPLDVRHTVATLLAPAGSLLGDACGGDISGLTASLPLDVNLAASPSAALNGAQSSIGPAIAAPTLLAADVAPVVTGVADGAAKTLTSLDLSAAPVATAGLPAASNPTGPLCTRV